MWVCMWVAVRMVITMAITMVVAVPTKMTARGIRAILRFKGLIYGSHDQVHGTQHVGQHVVGLNLQVVGLELDGHMAIAEVVGRTNQVIGRAVFLAMRDFQHRLRRGDHLDQ